ncbi:MAG: hypothetical protein KDA24_18760 [Deltaproteobacteria bacterium]|nr:hypothetical protein [Deltaproteobacteria bacterium]
MSIRPVLFALLLSAPGVATAGDVELPLDLEWCADSGDVMLALDDPRELSEGVIEAEAKAFGLRGTVTALTDEDMLVGLRFRLFDTDANLKAIKGTLTKRHGEGTWKDRSTEGGDRRLKAEWEVDANQTLALKVNSEQIYVAWEVDPSHCAAPEKVQEGLTDAEKADIEATTKKKAIAFDPYAEDIEDVEARKKAADDAKKSEVEKEEEKKKEEEPTDVEIDW